MRRKTFWWLGLSLFILLLIPISNAEALKATELIGRDVLNFTLPSTQDRLVNYIDDYYGKYNLVITFFPAAFTPI
jgi:hypothetical protein